MKTLLLTALALMLLLTMASCDEDQSAVQQAYQQGAANAIQELQNQVRQSKQQLKNKLQPKLFTGAIIVLLVTFFGDIFVERVREKLAVELELTPERQAKLVGGGYALLCAVISIWSLCRCGTVWSQPVFMLLTGATAVFLLGYLPALLRSEMNPRRLAMYKIKLLLFAVGVILTIHELLDPGGMIRLPG